MQKALRTFAIVVGGLWLAGCATTQKPYGQDAMSPEERRLQSLENQMTVVNRRLDAIGNSQRSGRLIDDVRNLRGKVEELQHEVEQNRKEMKLVMQSHQPGSGSSGGGGALPALDSGSSTGPMNGLAVPASVAAANEGSAPASAASSVAAASSSAAGNGAGRNNQAEQATYIHSFNALQAGKLGDAISGFKAMLKQYPNGNYADNAWYWLGSAYYVKGDSGDALSSFKTLLTRFPNSPKVPDALVKIGIIQHDNHEDAQARAAFQRVIKKYPDSNAASVAKQRLAKLGG